MLYWSYVIYPRGGSDVPFPPLYALMDPSYSHSGIFCLMDIRVQFKAFCPGMDKGFWGRVRT